MQSYKELIEPVRVKGSYEDEPKVRGVIASFMFATFTTLITTNIPSLLMFAGYLGWIKFAQICNSIEFGHPVGPYYGKFADIYVMIYLAMLFFTTLWTGLLSYYCFRTWPSFLKCFVFSIFAKRVGSSKGPSFIILQK